MMTSLIAAVLPLLAAMCFQSANGWLFTPAKRIMVAEHRRCDPADQTWRPYPKDPTRFLFCDGSKRKYLARQCPQVQGSQQVFDGTKKQCMKPIDLIDFKFNAAPNEQRVGDNCYINQDCADGMYCNNGICACFLNYIEVKMKCIRVSTICSTSHFYAELNTGKPRTCVTDVHCPVNFACESHSGGSDINFCCYKPATATNLCGGTQAFLENNKEMTCSPDFPQMRCPADHWCRYNTQLRRHFCCSVSGTDSPSTSSSTSSSTPSTSSSFIANSETFSPSPISTTLGLANTSLFAHASSSIGVEKVLGQTIALAQLVCGPGLAPWIFEGFPMPCNPLPPGVCPPGFICKSVNGSKLHFCCNDVYRSTTPATTIATATTASSITPNMTTISMSTSQPDSICSNSSPYLLHGQPLICIGSDPESCPLQYNCHFHPPSNISFCCTAVASSTSASTTKSSNHTLKGVAYSVNNETSVCGGSEPLMMKNTTVMCIKNDPLSCPPYYRCQYHEYTNALYCCSKELIPVSDTSTTKSLSISSSTTFSSTISASNEGCPVLTYPARDPVGRALTCSLTEITRSCPIDYNCTFSESNGRFQCCGFRPVPTLPSTSATKTSGSSIVGLTSTTPASLEEVCPIGQKAYKDSTTNTTKSCVVNTPGNCPAGYFCQFSSQANRFLCCGVHAGCPANSVALINPVTGYIQTCTNDEPLCPSSYHCATTAQGKKVCCSGEERLCVHGDPQMDVVKVRSCSAVTSCAGDFSCMPSRIGSICCPKLGNS